MLKINASRIAFLLLLAYHRCFGKELQELIDAQECSNAKVDMVVVMDSSGSVESVFDQYRDAAMDLVRMLPIGADRTLLSIVQYNDKAYSRLQFALDQNTSIVNETLHALEWLGGNTMSAEAVDLGINAYAMGRNDASKMFVLMTDGNSANSWPRVQETAKRLHMTGAKIYIVALGDSMYEPELKEYAGPNGTIIKRQDFNRFKGEILDLTGFICHSVARYQVSEAATEAVTVLPYGSPPAVSPEITVPTVAAYSTPPEKQPITTVPPTVPPETQPVTTVPSTVPSTGQPETQPITTVPPTSVPETQPITTPVPNPYEPQPITSPNPPSTVPATAVPTAASFAANKTCPTDVLFILDSSGSVRNDFDTQIKFISEVIDALSIDLNGHLVAVVEYAGEMRQRLQFSFTAYLNKQDLMAAVRALPFFSGTTATGEALKLGKTALADRRPSTPALIFVLTDGFSHDDVTQPAKDLRSESNTQLYAIGVTSTLNTRELINIAGEIDHAYFDGNATEVITDILPKYVACDIGPNPTGSSPAASPPVEPSTSASGSIGPEASTVALVTAEPTTEFISSGCLVDLIFILDSSGSVSQTFQRQLEFAASIVDRLVVGPQNAHIAAVKYAGPDKSRVIFTFNTHSNSEDVKKSLLSTSFISGTTATNEALELALKEYDVKKGARPGLARFIAVVFTDGFSHDDPSVGAKALHAIGATVYAIGVNKAQYPVNKAELTEIAGDESRVFTDETIDSLYGALDQLEQACKEASGQKSTFAPSPGGTDEGKIQTLTPTAAGTSSVSSEITQGFHKGSPARRYPPHVPGLLL